MPARRRALGQFCFDNDAIARFRDDAAQAGIAMPDRSRHHADHQFHGRRAHGGQDCGAAIPAWLARAYDGLDDDVESRRIVAAAVLADQVQQLRARGFDQFHFYTLNQANLTYAACRMLGLQPEGICHEFRPRRPHRLDEGGGARSAFCCSTAPGA